MKYIERQLNDWVPEGGYESYRLYELMLNSGYVVLPFAGGWLDQPAWVKRDFEKFMMMDEWAKLNSQLPVAPPRGAPKDQSPNSDD